MKIKLLSTILLLFVTAQIYACKCGGPGTVKESFQTGSFIIHGKVINTEAVSFKETVDPGKVKGIQDALKNNKSKLQLFDSDLILKVTLQVVRKFKGTYSNRVVTIYTSTQTSACGFKFKIGMDYIVYARPKSYLYSFFLPDTSGQDKIEKDNTFWTDVCTRTTEYNKEEANALNELKE